MVVKTSVLGSSIDKAVEQLQKNLEKKRQLLSDIFFARTLPSQLASQVVINMYYEAVSRVFMSWQAEYFDPSPIVAQTDPTGFDFWKAEIRAEVEKNIKTQASLFKGRKAPYSLNLTILSDEFLGLGESLSPNETTPIKWAKYFIEGPEHGSTILVWITPEVHADIRPNSQSNLGRFGAGYLIKANPGKDFSSLAARFNTQGYSIDNYIHPQTNMSARGGELQEAVAALPIEQILIEPAWKKTESLFLKSN